MLIVDGQIHLWEKGTPSPPHRQEPYSAEEAIAAMDQAGVDRALIHPVLWDPDSNELAVEAVRMKTAATVVKLPFFNPPRKTAVPVWGLFSFGPGVRCQKLFVTFGWCCYSKDSGLFGNCSSFWPQRGRTMFGVTQPPSGWHASNTNIPAHPATQLSFPLALASVAR